MKKLTKKEWLEDKNSVASEWRIFCEYHEIDRNETDWRDILGKDLDSFFNQEEEALYERYCSWWEIQNSPLNKAMKE
jgi:hypothetical protein